MKKPSAQLTAQQVHVCWKYAFDVVLAYERGMTESSRAYSIRGADRDVLLHAQGKMGEVAFALVHGLDPMKTLEWDAFDGAGAAHDIVVDNLLVDVKSIDPHKRFLCWPVSKNSIYQSKHFNVLALMRGSGANWVYEGWCEKAAFWEHALIADGINPGGLLKGTRYLDKRHIFQSEQCNFSENLEKKEEAA